MDIGKDITMEKVSVIVPIYNLEDQIERCVVSITRQTYDNLEILLMDDGSTDHSLQVCYRLARTDSRILVFSHENQGVSFTRNRGIMNACGKYIIFIDGDDELRQDLIETYVGAFGESVDIVVGGITRVDSMGNGCSMKPKPGLYSRNEFCQYIAAESTPLFGYATNKMYRADFIESNMLAFAEEMRAQEDLNFAISAFMCSTLICCIDYDGYIYYYQDNRRTMPVADYLTNQFLLRRLLESEKANTRLVCSRIQNAIFSSLYSANTIDEIREIEEISQVKEYLESERGFSSEKKLVFTIFRLNLRRLLLLYFCSRRFIKAIACKLKLLNRKDACDRNL